MINKIKTIIPVLFLAVSCQSGFIFFPDSEIETTPDRDGLKYEQVFFLTSDRVKLSGWWVPGEKSKGVILYCHGNAGNISHLMYFIKMYNRMNFSIFIFDYRGYGQSEGSPSEEGTYLDAAAAINFLTGTKKVKPGEIIIHGRSLGGAIAAWLAYQNHPRILIVESSFTTIRDAAKHHISCAPALVILTYKFETIKYIKETSCPVLVIHGKGDEVIPYDHGVKLFEAASNPKEFLEITGSHNRGFYFSSNYEPGIKNFINKYSKD